MFAPRLASFVLWAAAIFTLAGIAIRYEPSGLTELPAISTPANISYSAAQIQHLFAADTALEAKNVRTSDIQLKGIVFTTPPSQSRALIQISGGKVMTYSPGSQLPNGARLVEINQRAIVYEQLGTRHEVELPRQQS